MPFKVTHDNFADTVALTFLVRLNHDKMLWTNREEYPATC